jgi:hypothetical protein
VLLGEGEFKNTTEVCFQKNRKKIEVSFSSTSLFYRVFGCFSAMGVQKAQQKTFYKINRVENALQKIGQKPKTDFFLGSRFLDEGSKKTP